MSGFDPQARLRQGDASAWPRWDPEFLRGSEVLAGFAAALDQRGRPGFPEIVRVYTHFAYCQSSCSFCMYFHEVPSDASQYGRYVEHLVALCRGFERRHGRSSVSSAYIGGGTPSATPLAVLRRYLEAFGAAFVVLGEFTFEAHPWSMDAEKLSAVADAGVNRMSMGVQSFDEQVLRSITRRQQTLDGIAELVQGAQRHGLVVNLDLVLGLPGQTLESFQRDLQKLMSVGPDVITMYLYQPVRALPDAPAPALTYEAALSPLSASIEAAAYRIGDPIHSGSTTVRLLKTTDQQEQRWPPSQRYALFSDEASQLIGLGPGAYGHVYGYGWFREVTALQDVPSDEPRYWGTRLSPVDECRQRLLDAIARRRPIDLDQLAAETGADPRKELAPALDRGLACGLFLQDGAHLRIGDSPDRARDSVIEWILPPRPRRTRARTEPPGGYQRQLVALTRKDIDPELVRAFCEALGIPPRGRRFLGAVVHGMDDRSISFSLGRRPPLRVHVRSPGHRPSLFEAGPFAITYSKEPEQQLEDSERRFLEHLMHAMRQLPPAAKRRSAPSEPVKV
ncbi:MAG TPA: radical SAM protein [Polyangiaceae bacterium]|nr:radical SAM protein [Polyangiaceae bacterium]